jgi:hypothetical protein
MISLKNRAPSVEALAIAQQPKTSIQADSDERSVTYCPSRRRSSMGALQSLALMKTGSPTFKAKSSETGTVRQVLRRSRRYLMVAYRVVEDVAEEGCLHFSATFSARVTPSPISTIVPLRHPSSQEWDGS